MKYVFALCCFLTTALLFPGLAAGEWHTDFEKAKAESLKTGRPIYVLFTNSDSAVSLNLERTIFSQKKFQNYADKSLVLMKVDFPAAIHLQPKSLAQQNRGLRTKYAIATLPTMILLDANGDLYVDFVKSEGSAERYRRKMNEIMDFDPPKRYTEYLNEFVKKYTPPKPSAEAKPENKARAAKPDAKKPAKKQEKKTAQPPQDADSIDTNIPDENAGKPLIPLDPEGNFEDWLKASRTEEATGEAKETEEGKAPAEEGKEAVIGEAGKAKENAQAPAPAGE